MARSTPPTSLRTADAAPALTALVGLAVLIAAPPVADLAAHVYRAGLFAREGWTAWNAQWYGGHHVPAYSVLYPPLGAWIGVRMTGVVAALAATVLFARIARRATPDARRAGLAAWAFAATICANVVIGRMPFVLGVALALGAWLAGARTGGRARAGAAALAALATLASPVAGLFLALAGLARRDAALVLVPPLVAVPLMLAFPEGGTERFVASAFWPALAAGAGAVPLLRGRLRHAAILNLALLAGAFAIPSAMGANAARLGFLLGAPLLALGGARRRATALLAGALLALAWVPAVRALVQAHGDPATHRAFHAELVRALAPRVQPGDRLEIAFTRTHWEAAYIAPRIALARGWERQLDRKRNAPLYARDLDARSYARWLGRARVRFVALPAAPLDYSARREAELLRTGVPGLSELPATRHWRIWTVDGVPASPERTHTPTRFSLDAARPGAIPTPERWTRLWRVVEGSARVRSDPDGFTEVLADAPGRIVVLARWPAG